MKNNTDTAKETIRHFLNGVYAKQEAKVALALLRDGQNNPFFDSCMSDLWQEIQNDSGPNELEYKRELENAGRLFEQINERTITYQLVRKILSVAASVAILIAIGGGIFHYLNRRDGEKNNIHYTQFSTVHGQIRDMLLPDGTKVTLNTCSQLSYPAKSKDGERLVKLKGEAYFQVL